MSAERGQTIDLTDPKIQEELKTYTSLIAQGRGRGDTVRRLILRRRVHCKHPPV
jgi:hypothetical protein